MKAIKEFLSKRGFYQLWEEMGIEDKIELLADVLQEILDKEAE